MRAWEVTFHDAENGGNVLGTTQSGTVTVSAEGLFNIAVTPPSEVIDAAEVWYSVGVDTDDPVDNDASDDVFPDRIQVLSVPFALQAQEVVAVDAMAVADGSVDNTEFQQLDGVSSNIQQQIDAIDTSGIGTNASNIAQNTSDIADNAADISQNTTDIATNAGIIDTNTTAIAGKADAADVAQNTSDIADNAAAIALKANSADVYTQAAADTAFVDATGDTMSGALGVDTVNEATADAGVNVDGVLLKDSFVSLAQTTAPGDPADKLYNVGGSLFFNGVQVDATTVGKDAINNAGTLGFEWADIEVSDTLTIGSGGSVDNGAFSALGDLQAESAIGTGSGQVAAGDHDHNLQNLSGAVTDAQVPDALTIQGGSVNNDSFSAISDLGAESAIGTGAAQVAAGDHSHMLQDLGGAVTDAQVPDNITITEADTLADVTGRGASTASNISLSGAAQSITFTNPTGIVGINSDSVLGLGLEGLTILNGSMTSVGQIQFNDDSAANPAMTYGNDPNTGVHRPGNDQLALVTNGVSRLTVDNAEVNLTGNVMEIATGTAPGTTTNKLYNTGGNLFWNGTQLNGGGGGSTSEVWRFFGRSQSLVELAATSLDQSENVTHDDSQIPVNLQFINVPYQVTIQNIQVYVNEYEAFTGTRVVNVDFQIRDISTGTLEHTVAGTFNATAASSLSWSTISLSGTAADLVIETTEFLSARVTLAGTDGGNGGLDLTFRITVTQ
jgi:hypothetical protein